MFSYPATCEAPNLVLRKQRITLDEVRAVHNADQRPHVKDLKRRYRVACEVAVEGAADHGHRDAAL